MTDTVSDRKYIDDEECNKDWTCDLDGSGDCKEKNKDCSDAEKNGSVDLRAMIERHIARIEEQAKGKCTKDVRY